jgi:hypothetical protein
VDAYYGGTIFELSPQIGGLWKETVLHNFQNNGQDGAIPDGGPILDSAGNLYGVTQIGGTHLTGTAFELLRQSGNWTEKIRHNFGHGVHDGHYPNTVVLDSLGNLYGTTSSGGAYDGGTVFQLMP